MDWDCAKRKQKKISVSQGELRFYSYYVRKRLWKQVTFLFLLSVTVPSGGKIDIHLWIAFWVWTLDFIYFISNSLKIGQDCKIYVIHHLISFVKRITLFRGLIVFQTVETFLPPCLLSFLILLLLSFPLFLLVSPLLPFPSPCLIFSFERSFVAQNHYITASTKGFHFKIICVLWECWITRKDRMYLNIRR